MNTPARIHNETGIMQVSKPIFDNSTVLSHGLGEGRNYTVATHGVFVVNGSISGEVVDFSPLQYAIGDRQGADSSGDPYEFVEQDQLDYTNGLKTVTLQVGHDGPSNDSVFDVTGVFYNSLSLSGEIGGVLRFDLGWIGKTVTKSTSAVSYTTPSARPYSINNLSVTDGTNNINVQSFTWGLENNASMVYDIAEYLKKKESGRKKFRITIEYPEIVGWQGTIERFYVEDDKLENYQANDLTRGLRITDLTIPAPKTKLITLAVEIKKENIIAVFLRSIYPGRDIGPINQKPFDKYWWRVYVQFEAFGTF